MTPLAEVILRTLAFFDAQDMPLTLMEVRNYLIQADGEELRRIEETLQGELAGAVGFVGGFYFLRGREELPDLRRQRYRTSLIRFRRARFFLRGLRYMPYVRAIAISGSQALLQSSRKSDIDLLLIAAPQRIWLCRLLVSLYFQILGVRRHSEKIENRFCLNHYVSAGRPIEEDKNLYTAVEYASLIPMLGAPALQDFYARNGWIRDFLPMAEPPVGSMYGYPEFSPLQKIFESVFDYTIGGPLNHFSGLYQKNRIRRQEHILVSDHELSFHPGSRGQKVLKKFDLTKRQFGV